LPAPRSTATIEREKRFISDITPQKTGKKTPQNKRINTKTLLSKNNNNERITLISQKSDINNNTNTNNETEDDNEEEETHFAKFSSLRSISHKLKRNAAIAISSNTNF
jgi:hypothetical protein